MIQTLCDRYKGRKLKEKLREIVEIMPDDELYLDIIQIAPNIKIVKDVLPKDIINNKIIMEAIINRCPAMISFKSYHRLVYSKNTYIKVIKCSFIYYIFIPQEMKDNEIANVFISRVKIDPFIHELSEHPERENAIKLFIKDFPEHKDFYLFEMSFPVPWLGKRSNIL